MPKCFASYGLACLDHGRRLLLRHVLVAVVAARWCEEEKNKKKNKGSDKKLPREAVLALLCPLGG